MTIFINGKSENFPSSLNEITLIQRIQYQIVVLDEIDKMIESIKDMKDKEEQELELLNIELEKIYRTIAFFTNCTVEAIKELNDIDTIANIYYSNINQLFKEESEASKSQELRFLFKDAFWYIDVPELKNGSSMSFGEFIDSKQIVQDMIKLGKNRWECLLPLTVIFLRRENELYEESFLYEGSERLKLMEELPLNIAIQVGFFLSNSLNMFIRSSQSSIPQELKLVEDL